MSPAPANTSPRPGAPFVEVRADVLIALVFAAVTIVWASVGGLPGGRWLAVHLFTLGVVTPLIVAFSHHQATSLLRAPGRRRTWARLALVGGAALLAAGVATTSTPAIAAGATLNAAAVAVSWWRLHQDRRAALGPRFAWMVRGYERAHGAYLIGALLGALLGVGLIPGWAFVGVRQAHLHAMVLGFAAVTLLTTAVLYGPMLLRAQLAPGAESSARRWVARTSTAALVAVLALLGRALPDPWGVASRWMAASALLVAALGAGAVALPLARTVRAKGARAPLAGILLTAAVGWLCLGIAADAAVVATASWRWHDPLGAVVMVGALAQAITATLMHVLAVWQPRQRRLAIWRRLDAIPAWAAVVPQVAIMAFAVAVAR
jgi:hypothetical protein